jgi:glycosyltransferase involved in cell wall biosynthesis
MNEERDLPDCLRSLQELATEVYVVDSGSADRTTQIAHQYGAAVVTHAFESHSQQFNWALDNISTNADWILRIDADERLHPNLTRELLLIIPNLPVDVTGLVVSLRIRFLGRDMRFGDMYPVWLLRIWRNGFGRCEERLMDERIVLKYGRSITVRGDLIHEIPKSLTEWTTKHNGYATSECTDILSAEPIAQLEGIVGTRRRLKQSVYLCLPLFHRAFVYWFYRYVFRLGFLDGKAGLIYHFLHGFWYRFLVDAKLYESSLATHTPLFNPDESTKLR